MGANPRFGAFPQSNAYAAGALPSTALDSGALPEWRSLRRPLS
jgi:hypothetical protein